MIAATVLTGKRTPMVDRLISRAGKYKEAGIAGLFALVLLGFVLNTQAKGQAQQSEHIDQLRRQVQDLSATVGTHVSDTNHLLFQICLNVAQNANQLAGCQEAGR